MKKLKGQADRLPLSKFSDTICYGTSSPSRRQSPLYLISCGTSTVVVPVDWFPALSVVTAVMVYSLPSISVSSRQDSSVIALPKPETVLLQIPYSSVTVIIVEAIPDPPSATDPPIK